MNNTPDVSEHAWILFDAALDQAISDEQRLELEMLLLTNKPLRRLFLAHLQLRVDIRFLSLARQGADRALGDIFGLQKVTPSEQPPELTATKTARSKSWLDRMSKRPMRPALAVATIFLVVAVTWAAMTYVNGVAKRDNPSNEKQVKFVAHLVQATEAKWKVANVENPNTKQSQPIEIGMKLYSGQKLSLATGAAMLKFESGATVLLEGPAEFEVKGNKECGLEFGKLVARCATKRAEGFMVQTPLGQVKDLGTEFGVRVMASGRSDVRVFDGRVAVLPGDGSPAREFAVNESLALIPTAGGGVHFAPTTVSAHLFLRSSAEVQFVGVHLHDNVVQKDLYRPQMNAIPVAMDDLVEAGAATLARANPIDFLEHKGLDFANINDGTSEAQGDGVFEMESFDGSEWVAEFVLDTSTNTAGYDITQIDSIASWVSGRIQQRLTVTYSTVDKPEQFNNLLGTFTNTDKVPQTTGSSRIRLTDAAGEVLAARVKAIRLRYTNHGLGNTYLPVVQEVDVFGSATKK